MSHSVVLNWGAPSDAVASSTYNIYKATGVCPASGLGSLSFSKIGNTGALMFTDPNVSVGDNVCYYGTQVQGSQESAPGNTAGGTVKPSTVTIQLVIN